MAGDVRPVIALVPEGEYHTILLDWDDRGSIFVLGGDIGEGEFLVENRQGDSWNLAGTIDDLTDWIAEHHELFPPKA